MRGPRFPAPWLLLPLDGALHYPEIQTGQRGQSLGGGRGGVCDLLAQGSVFTAMLPLLSLPAGASLPIVHRAGPSGECAPTPATLPQPRPASAPTLLCGQSLPFTG